MRQLSEVNVLLDEKNLIERDGEHGVRYIYKNNTRVECHPIGGKITIMLPFNDLQYMIYDSDMDHMVLYFRYRDNLKIRNISKYVDNEAYAFQQSLLQESFFGQEDLKEFIQYYKTIEANEYGS